MDVVSVNNVQYFDKFSDRNLTFETLMSYQKYKHKFSNYWDNKFIEQKN